jgi:hypothetical protein
VIPATKDMRRISNHQDEVPRAVGRYPVVERVFAENPRGPNTTKNPLFAVYSAKIHCLVEACNSLPTRIGEACATRLRILCNKIIQSLFVCWLVYAKFQRTAGCWLLQHSSCQNLFDGR